jgi:hypothetical protein
MATKQEVSLLLISIILFLVSGCASLPESTSGRVEVEKENTQVVVVFNDYDSHLIREYYRKHLRRLPPGLAKRDRLPPGLEKQIVRKGTLPPGLAGKPLPGELERKLTPLPDGYVRIRVGGDVVLLDERTRVVMDVIYDVTE